MIDIEKPHIKKRHIIIRMVTKNITLTALAVVCITITTFLMSSTNTVCNNSFWNNAKKNKEVKNIELCIKEGNVNASILLSRMYANGDKVEKNYTKAIEIIETFAKSGNSIAMIQMGDLYSTYNECYDVQKAELWYKKAINNRDAYLEKAEMNLAYFYNRKYYASKNIKYINLYIDYLTNIANRGNVEAMRLLSKEYQEGDVINQDYYLSMEWLKRAAEKGDVSAHRSIGNYYANGFIGEPDYIQARNWLKKALSMGDNIAEKRLDDNPSPLGLEITKSTIHDFKTKFPKYLKLEEPNFINGGSTYLVNHKYIEIEGIQSDAIFVFNKNSILESVLIVFDHSKYNEIQSHLEKKYRPLINGAQDRFNQGFTEIILRHGYVLYSPQIYVPKHHTNLCTLIYNSSAFSIKVFEKEKFIENKKKQKMNIL